MFAGAGLFIVLCIGSLIFSVLFHQSLLQVHIDVDSEVHLIGQKRDKLVDTIQQSNLTVLLSGDVESVVSHSRNIEVQAYVYGGYLGLAENVRFVVLCVIIVVCMAGCGLAVIKRACTIWSRWPLACVGALNAILWSCIGFHATLGIAFADACLLAENPVDQVINPLSKVC